MLRYGINWSPESNPLEIEMQFIRHGGYITHKGNKYGEGLFHHYRELQRILWPDGEDHHRWTDLMLREILENRITAISGSRDSGKTHVALSRYGLTDYFVFPNETLILVSSTDLRGLQLRVWGDMKDLLSKAKERHPSLPGHVVESLHGIFTDRLSEDTPIRDIRKGIICFVEGTMVDTPTGPHAIETIQPGDLVFNAAGVGTVRATYERIAPEIVRVGLSDGRAIECTPNHPFFTARGWIKAVDLMTFDRVYSACETMSLLWQSPGAGIPEPEVLFDCLSGTSTAKDLRTVQETVSALASGPGKILQHRLRGSLGGKSTQRFRAAEMRHLREANALSSESEILLCCVPGSSANQTLSSLRKTFHLNPAVENEGANAFLQRVLQEEISWSVKFSTAFQTDARGIGGVGVFPRSHLSLSPSHWIQDGEWSGSMVRAGHSVSRSQAGCGNRRRGSQYSSEFSTGWRENQNPIATWVESVEILKPRSESGFSGSKGGYRVHNLSVDGHPSYSVNGVIVHNCIPCLDRKGTWVGGLEKFVGIKQKRRRVLGDEVQFMHSEYLTVLSNLDKGDFKGVFVGNALANMKALDKISEPIEGWGNHADPTKTEVFKNRYGGTTITLVGTDSPNYDYPEDQPTRYPYLVDRKDEKSVGDRYGRNSEQYYSQIAGFRKPGLYAHRVLTQEMCEQYGAFKEVVWSGGEQTVKVYAVDMGFGGDRAVAGWGEFGKEVGGGTVVRIHPPSVIPIGVDSEPEDQIALYVRKDATAAGIIGANVFYDAGMRATAAVAMSKIFSPDCNAVNFGGNPTKRPVSANEFVIDPSTGTKRLKRCDEHYIKFVTELWFSVRLTVMAGQMRELPRDVAEEFYLREWTKEKGDKYELEKKEDTKDRTGVSPDLGDWLSILIEGARRLGFMIENLPEFQGQNADNDDYLQKELTRYQRERKKRTLNYR